MIKVNVSGKIFEVDVNILMKSDYFKAMISDRVNNDVIYVKRSSHVFKHVLACLIDDNYMCPIQYQNELKYFLIQHNNWYDPHDDTNKIIKKLIDNEIHIINYHIADIRDNIRDLDDKYEKLCNKPIGILSHSCKRVDCNDECKNGYNYCLCFALSEGIRLLRGLNNFPSTQKASAFCMEGNLSL